MNNENNDPKKSIDNLSNDQVDGKDVKGGFGPGRPFGSNPAPDMLPDGPPVDDGLGGPPQGGEWPTDPANEPLPPDLPGQMPIPGGPLGPGPMGGGPGPMPRP